MEKGSVCAFDTVAKEAQLKHGVKEITYEQFMALRSSHDPFVLLDVLGTASYETGHIPGAKSLPVKNITRESAGALLPAKSKVVVYCAGFTCHASTKAAVMLTGFGYDVLDYKGGKQEWIDKGHKLER
jgi:rhodanese-related sulfurtransferase